MWSKGLIVLAITLLLGINAFAEDEICLPMEEAKNLVVELEKGKGLKEQVELYRQANEELEKQVNLLKEMNKLKDEQIAIGDRTIKQYQELLKFQKETYEQAVKDAKPGLLKQIIDAIGVIGIVAGVALL
jgi:hypothetical protein